MIGSKPQKNDDEGGEQDKNEGNEDPKPEE
jgi:hypothetical protein